MRSRTADPRLIVALGMLLVLGACTSTRGAEAGVTTSTVASVTAPDGGESPTTEAPTTEAPTTITTTTTTTTDPATTPPTTTTPPITTTSPTTRPPRVTTTTTASTTSTTLVPSPDPACVRRIQPGDSLEAIVADLADATITVVALQAENGIVDPDLINAGDDLDVCIGNGVNDATGREQEPDAPPPTDPVARAVQTQQRALNRLFGGTGLPTLDVDGDSGRLTRQQLCAARLALGLPVNRDDMVPGSAEARALRAATTLPIPSGAPVDARRWVLIDRTCQVLFAGEAGRLVFVFQTSTGSPGHETRDQEGSRVFRFDPARENGGWHNSTQYPVPADNPLNGNMYQPLYFDAGQAIHGANNVPTDPQSKGCVRLRVESQRALVYWLGLSGAPSPVWDSDDIDLTVDVQGTY